jgi:hypothetical protein
MIGLRREQGLVSATISGAVPVITASGVTATHLASCHHSW